jgi:hypothetical protein
MPSVTVRRALGVIAALAVGSLFVLPKAQANPVPVSGTWNACGHNLWDMFHQAGRNFTIKAYQNQIFFGSVVGTLYCHTGRSRVRCASSRQGRRDVAPWTFPRQRNLGGFSSGKDCERGSGIHLPRSSRSRRLTGQAIYSFNHAVAGIHGEFTMLGSPPDPNPYEVDGCYVTGTYTGQVQLTP